MGESILTFYRSRVKKNWKIAFYAVLVIGLMTHLYKFTNTLLNHDALFHTYTPQNAIGSGRWFLTVACGLSSFFDLPLRTISIILNAILGSSPLCIR